MLELDKQDQWRQLGEALLRNARFHGPLYWGLVERAGEIYALAAVPARDGRPRNELGVFRLVSR